MMGYEGVFPVACAVSFSSFFITDHLNILWHKALGTGQSHSHLSFKESVLKHFPVSEGTDSESLTFDLC